MRTEALKRIALGILCLAALAACGGETKYTDKENGFEVTIPMGVGVNRDDAKKCTFHEELDVKAVMSMSIDVGDALGLRSFFDNKDNKKMLSGWTLTGIQRGTLCSASCFRLDIETADLKMTLYYAVAGGRSYTFVDLGV